jgi:Family of unknown function (DUF6220)
MRATLSAPTEVQSSITQSEPVFTIPAQHAGQRGAQVYRMLARILLGALALQLFFAGLGVFGVTSFLPHAILGTLIVLASFAMPIVAWRGHLDSAILRRSWLLVGLMLVQGLLIDAGRILPAISALHPVNAMLLVLVTYGLTRRDI